MKNIVINYTLQNEDEKASYAYFLPPTFNNLQELKIKDILDYFPLKNSGGNFHFRFKTITSREPKITGWLDISNLNARVPLYENQVHMKVLKLPSERGSKIFRAGSDYAKVMSKLSSGDLEPKPTTNRQSAPEKIAEKQQPQPQQPNISKSQKVEPQHQGGMSGPIRSSSEQEGQKKKSSMHLMDDFEDQPEVKKETKKTAADLGSLGADFMGGSTNNGSEYAGLTHDQITALKAQKLKEEMDKKAKEFKDNIEKDEKAKVERAEAYAEFEEKIRKWAFQGGQRNNVTTLLITVHEICWPDCEWKPLGLSDCLNANSIKKNYIKAIRFFHPDKNQHADFKQKYIAERVFNIINEAWNEHQVNCFYRTHTEFFKV